MTDIKFCGLTRPQDAAFAASLGARYVGCVFAGGPRHRTPADAATVFGALDPAIGPKRTGVFADARPQEIEAAIRVAGLQVVQLHAASTRDAVASVRQHVGRETWAVVRCAGAQLPADLADLWAASDALVLDAKVAGQLGGTGRPLPWEQLADAVRRVRDGVAGGGRLVLAGGLTPDNVARAIAALHPDIVDTSSGVESAPGIKDPGRMTAFVEAVADADRSARPL